MHNKPALLSPVNPDADLVTLAGMHDFATIGWFALDRAGLIIAANAAGTHLLGLGRPDTSGRNSAALGQAFDVFLAEPERAAFGTFLARLFAGQPGLSYQAALPGARQPPRTVHIEATLSPDQNTCSLLAIDSARVCAFSAQGSETHFRAIVEEAVDAFFLGDSNGHLVRVNQLSCALTGYSQNELLSMSISDLFPGEELTKLPLRYDLLDAGKLLTRERLLRRKDGSRIPIEMKSRRMSDGTFQSLFRDLTERKHSEARLQLAASVFSHAREGIIITDMDGRIVEVNDAFSKITGYSHDEVLGQNPRILGSGQQSAEFYATLWRTLGERGHWSGETVNRRKNGDLYPQLLTISVVRDATGSATNYVALFSDITAIHEHKKQLEHVANHDVLTNLPNRTLLTDRLHQAISYCQRRQRSLAVAYLDLDGFKSVNERFGRDVGDEMLTIIAQRLKSELLEGDTLARIGSDEFIAVLGDLETTQDCEPIIARLLAATATPVAIRNIELQVSGSIGVTLYPHDGADADQLIRHADQAMYLAKQAGKNRYHLFDVDQDAAVKTLRATLEEIQRGLEQQQFVLHYQPKVNMKSGLVTGAEALIRWQHPERGLLPPAAFLPLVEDSPIGVTIGEWVITTALDQMVAWEQRGVKIPLSINVGARQLQGSGFVLRLRELLAARPSLAASQLEIEILESSALEDISQISEIMLDCRRIGIHFAIDDFGTGYSSLTYLRRLPAQHLKIDQSFVRDMLVDPDDLAIVQGVIGLAKAFRRRVIAEGVESVAHGELLLKLGCELAQGFGIARPMPGDELPAWVAAWQPDVSWTDRNQDHRAAPD